MDRVDINLKINNVEYCCTVTPDMSLLECIREVVGLTGTKCGCGNGECGACTIILNGEPVRPCIILAVEADGSQITTVEGLAKENCLSPLQDAFIAESAVQCGYCIPGILMAASALLERNQNPSEAEVLEALEGHLCRCGGYEAMSHAVQRAAEALAR